MKEQAITSQAGFPCPQCGEVRNSIVDSRYSQKMNYKRRRWVCLNGHRFSTYEITDRRCKDANRTLLRAIKEVDALTDCLTELEKQLEDRSEA